jgi:hypothetical protein
MKDARAGLKPKNRKLATTTKKKKLTANQWQNTPQQNKFMELWTDPLSATFSNAYKSAIAAGYSEHYARIIASPNTCNKWISEYQRLSKMELEHLEQRLSKIVNGTITRNESNSPEDTRIRAIELYAKLTGKLDQRNQVKIAIVQPILGGASVKKVIDQE